jgi:hypothetical protein
MALSDRTCKVVAVLALVALPHAYVPELAAASLPSTDAPISPAAPDDRNANVWSRKAHQPRQTDVEAAERARGETSAQRENSISGELDAIQRQLDEIERRYPPGFLQDRP